MRRAVWMGLVVAGCGGSGTTSTVAPPPAPTKAPKAARPGYVERCGPVAAAADRVEVGPRGDICALSKGELQCVHFDRPMYGTHRATLHHDVLGFALSDVGACTLGHEGIRCNGAHLYDLEKKCATQIWNEHQRVCGRDAAGAGYCQELRPRAGTGKLIELGVTPPGAFAPSVGARCFATIERQLRCEGAVDEGAETAPQSQPPVAGVVRVVAGDGHFCSLTDEGQVHCWGRNGRVQVGGPRRLQWRPVLVALPVPAIDIAAGYRHSCAASKDGSVWCWGDGTEGQATGGEPGGRELPTCRSLDERELEVQVAKPRGHGPSRGVDTKVVREERFDESAVCVHPTEPEVRVVDRPRRVEGITAVALSAGGSRTCALDEQGHLSCWGGTPARFEADLGW